MGLFGTMGGLQGALGGMFGGGGQKLPPAASRGRGGLFGSGVSGEDAMMMLARAQAIMAGDHGTAAQITSQMQRGRLAQAEAEREAEAAESQYLSAHQGLSAQGIDKHAIAGMRPEDRSALLREALQPRQFGAEGGSLYNPSTQAFTRAPSQRQVGRTIVDMPAGNNPRPIYEGVEPVAVTDGGSVYGMRGDGSFVNPSGNQPAPQTSGPVRVNTPEEARSLPPGTEFQTPDGRIMRVPGGGATSGSRPFPPGVW